MHVQPILKHVILVAVFICGHASFAQQAQIPFEQIQRDSQSSVALAQSNSAPPGVVPPEPAPQDSSSATPSRLAAPASVASSATFNRVPAVRSPEVADAKFLFLNGQHLVLSLADIELSQRCIDAHTCTEANPLMPSSLAGKLSVTLGIFAYATATSYYLKKHRSRWWWAPPVLGVGIHTVGLMSGLAH
jgi:hypothetical protein